MLVALLLLLLLLVVVLSIDAKPTSLLRWYTVVHLPCTPFSTPFAFTLPLALSASTSPLARAFSRPQSTSIFICCCYLHTDTLRGSAHTYVFGHTYTHAHKHDARSVGTFGALCVGLHRLPFVALSAQLLAARVRRGSTTRGVSGVVLPLLLYQTTRSPAKHSTHSAHSAHYSIAYYTTFTLNVSYRFPAAPAASGTC
uniref:Putative secreted protein n=1 Tax=Anopheles darlingi TaxID=43151 RepID=A0A2M4DBS2_ANODA